MLHIRPHHINCIFFYRGLGYNFEFTSNMNRIISKLHTDSDITIKLICECDSLCSHCPNKSSNNKCLYDNNVQSLDLNTLRAYKLKNNGEYSFKAIINSIYKNYNYNIFENICNGCEWFKKGVCSKELIDAQKRIWLGEDS